MQIVIDIPGYMYKEIVEKEYHSTVDSLILDGVILPKGHGRLIDADYLKDVMLLHNFHGNNKNIVPYSDRRGYRLRQQEVDKAIINAPTVIEADKAESEG